MPWPPTVGDPLPRPANVWFEQGKLEWILGAKGHGHEWARGFQVGPEDCELVWKALAEAALGATVIEVRDRSPHGISCGVEVRLAINKRAARTIVSWHYAIPIAAPRLVTAYPTP